MTLKIKIKKKVKKKKKKGSGSQVTEQPCFAPGGFRTFLGRSPPGAPRPRVRRSCGDGERAPLPVM